MTVLFHMRQEMVDLMGEGPMCSYSLDLFWNSRINHLLTSSKILLILVNSEYARQIGHDSQIKTEEQ